MTQPQDILRELVMSRCQIEVLKARERYERGGFGTPYSKSKQAERRYVNFKCYLYRRYGVYND